MFSSAIFASAIFASSLFGRVASAQQAPAPAFSSRRLVPGKRPTGRPNDEDDDLMALFL